MSATQGAQVDESAPSTPSSQTPRTAARSRAQVAASYVGTFIGGIGAAVIGLVAVADKVAEHQQAKQVLLEFFQVVGLPGTIAIVSGVLLWKQAAHYQGVLSMLGDKLAASIDRVAKSLTNVEARVDELHRRSGSFSVDPNEPPSPSAEAMGPGRTRKLSREMSVPEEFGATG